MTARRPASSKDGAKTASQEQLRRTTAFRAVFNGNSTRDEGEVVLTHLMRTFGFFEPPTLDAWLVKTGSPAGYELNCALHAARLEPIRTILNHLNFDDDFMIALEQAAQR